MKNFFLNLRIKYKIGSIILMAVLCAIAFSIVFLTFLRSSLVSEKKDKLRNVVETAYGVIAHNHKLFTDGAMPEDQAKAAAMAALKALRYNEDEYFWVNDDKLPYPTMIMHPLNPALDGKPLDDAKYNCATTIQAGLKGAENKTDGKKNLFQAGVEVANAAGEGFIAYQWPKPVTGGGVSEERYPKISFVKKFPAWNWIIGSGIYWDDINTIYWHQAEYVVTFIIVFIILLAIIGWYVSNHITNPLSEISRKVEDLANGDLTVKIEYTSKDEAGSLAQSMNLMVSSIRQIVGSIIESSADVIHSVGSLKAGSERTLEGTNNQSLQAAQIATAAEEMSQTISDIARNSSIASESSKEAMDTAANGKDVADGAVETVHRVYASTVELSTMVDKLNSRALEIGEIVTVIKDIADQTNLLALNAAIEAARAGEQGRGFSVVADEVRKLAERTIKATAEITDKIQAVQAESQQTSRSMQDASTEVTKAQDYIRQVGDSLNHIVDSVRRVEDQITQIATAVEEQASVAGEVTSNIEKTSDISKDMEKMAHDVMDEVNILHGVAESLKISSAGFHLDGSHGQTTEDFIQWSDVFSVNIKLIDEQHKQLFRLINDLYAAWKSNKPREVMGNVFSGLLDYTDKHFKQEEEIFNRYGYPETSNHMEIHRALVKQVVETKNKFDRGEIKVNADIMNFLKNWLNNHILRVDKKYSAFLNSKGVV
ncbi:MAG: bacteriohemerythrin [Dissulfurispiraceae bacterium]